MDKQEANEFAPVELTRHSHGIGSGGRCGSMLLCNLCARKDVDIAFRSPQSVAAQIVGMTPAQFRNKSFMHQPKCPTCNSYDISLFKRNKVDAPIAGYVGAIKTETGGLIFAT